MNVDNISTVSTDDLALAGRRFQWLFHHSPNVLAVLSPDGVVLTVSDSILRTLGYTPGEIVGRSFFDIVHADDRDGVRDSLARPEGGTEPDLVEFRVRHKDGTERYLEAANSDPMVEPGLSGVLVTARDVTKRRELQRQLLRSQRLETIGSLAGGVAHDLNNILAPILMAVELLKLGVTDTDKLNMLQIMEKSALKGRGIVKQVLTFARGSVEARTLVQPHLLIREAVEISTQTFPPGIMIRQTVSPDCWTMRVDATQVHQVLMNLLVNARDAMGDSGCITITAENMRVDQSYAQMVPGTFPGPYVVLTIADTGSGIPAEHLRRIFDPFYTTKDIDKGTGLGLATVKQIIEAHKGAVAVESMIGNGTTFCLHLPAAEGEAAVADAGAVTELPFGDGELIVVADDDESIRDITKQTLEAYGYVVRTAANGAEALALVIQEAARARIIFTDFAMPIMDGRQLINAIRKMGLAVKVVLASGTSTSAETKQLVGGDADAILAKPFTAGRLLTTVHELLHPAPAEPGANPVIGEVPPPTIGAYFDPS